MNHQYVWILYLETGDYDDYMKTVEGVFASKEAAEAAGAAYPCRGRKHPVIWKLDESNRTDEGILLEEVYYPSCGANGHDGLLIQKYPLLEEEE